MNARRLANQGRGGFTLIELMITVAMIGILAATAVSSFQLYQRRSKRSEASSNLAGLRTAQIAYFHEAGGFIAANPSPWLGAPYPGVDRQNWQAGGGTFPFDPPGSGFHLLGWTPEGPTYFDYEAVAQNGPAGWYFTGVAYGDTDGDGALSAFMYVYPDSTGATLPSTQGGALVAPFNPNTCSPQWNTVAQVPSIGGCGFPVADDY